MKSVMGKLVPLLTAVALIFSFQVKTGFASATVSRQPVLKETKKKAVVLVKKKSSLSKPLLIGLGAAVLVGGAVALGSSGGGGSDGPATPATPPASPTPPTPDQLVSAWHAEASQVGSGLTYSGTYELFQGGGVAYNLYVSDGEHMVGGGGWRLDGYSLTIHTDHGSVYRGNLQPGNLRSVSLNASNTGWSVTLTR